MQSDSSVIKMRNISLKQRPFYQRNPCSGCMYQYTKHKKYLDKAQGTIHRKQNKTYFS